MSADSALNLLRAAGLPSQIGGSSPVQHVRTLPPRAARGAAWPNWVPAALRAGYRQVGVTELYTHQVQAAEALRSGQHTIVATGTASGKSLATQLAGLSAICADASDGAGATEATMLYLSPTKALAADQLDSLQQLAEAVGTTGRFGGIRPSAYDGDTDQDSRRWARQHANVILTNPDMLNAGILANHRGWARFFARLRYVIIDEAHTARGIFGSHTALLMRRLRRVARHYGAEPVFAGASATSGNPARSFARLIGEPEPADLVLQADDVPTVTAVDADGSPHGPVDIILWESSPAEQPGDHGAPRARSLTVEAADVLSGMVTGGYRTLAFIGSRRGAEMISQIAQDNVTEVDPALSSRVAAYRSGYLPEERRELEGNLRTGALLGVASTPALELGIDITGLDVVIVAGWPGTRASFFQQVGRAGRSGAPGAAVFIAGDDPLDAYLLEHPEAIFAAGVEEAVTDPRNPHVAAAHLLAAAAEVPIIPDELRAGGLWEGMEPLVQALTEQGHLRRRPRGWFFGHDDVAAQSWVNLRSDGGGPYTIVESEHGTIIGDISGSQVLTQAHPQAVYVHQGRSFIVDDLDSDARTVLVTRADPPFYTQARQVTSIRVIEELIGHAWGPFRLCFGEVEVTHTVVGFQRKAIGSGDVISDEPLDLPPSDLRTRAMWISAGEETLQQAGVIVEHVPGALHAAEHAMIGMLPLLTSSDRWDIGGVSTALHRDTEQPTIFVYDGHPGGAGFAERGFQMASTWLEATATTIADCDCPAGCPRCVQSPKCGNKNSPLNKAGALALLRAVLAEAPV